MHKSSMLRMKCFVDNYVVGGKGKKVLDIGSYDVCGSYKMLFSGIDIKYIGLDIERGPNVDIVMDELYSWDALQDEEFDYIISGQAFEHIEYPWLTIKEMYKKLKPDGIICVIAPNGLLEHKFPLDCYRYYADGMCAIAKWGGFEIIEVSVAGIPDEKASIEWDDIWNDVCLVACKSKSIKDNLRNKVMFPLERRFSPILDLKLQYDFISKWKFDEEKTNKMITNFISKGKYDEVYIIGCENTGVLLAKLLNSKKIKYKMIKTEKRIFAKDYFFESGKISEKDVCKDSVEDSLCILTVLDTHRKLMEEIEQKYHFSKVMYLDVLVKYEEEQEIINQMRKYFQSCPNIYIYGAGVNGKRIIKILEKHLFEVSGFVVSTEKYEEYRDRSDVYNITEIHINSGIIISPNDDEIIKKTLKNLEFKTCFDGKKLLW